MSSMKVAFLSIPSKIMKFNSPRLVIAEIMLHLEGLFGRTHQRLALRGKTSTVHTVAVQTRFFIPIDPMRAFVASGEVHCIDRKLFSATGATVLRIIDSACKNMASRRRSQKSVCHTAVVSEKRIGQSNDRFRGFARFDA
ncbi:hypothetical protein OKW38_007221 [Paraburkholderia sp. MM5496-R1]